MEKMHYIPQGGVCSKSMTIEMDENEKIIDVQITKGCPGNSLGLSALLVGMSVRDAIRILDGVKCRDIETSCPDQLAQAMKVLLDRVV